MRLIIHDDNDALSKACAEYVMTQIRHAAPTAERPFVMAIPTGNTAKGVYKHLCSLFKAGEVSFEVRAAGFKGSGRSWPGSAGFSWPAEPYGGWTHVTRAPLARPVFETPWRRHITPASYA